MSTCRHLPAGSMAGGPWLASITPEQAGWAYSGLRILGLRPGGSHAFGTAGDEMVVLPLAGSCVVECDGERFDLAGRASVFAGLTDFAYLPRGAQASISSSGGGRFALACARARQRLAARYGPAENVPVEVRGAGNCTRQVTNFCMPATFPADRLIACEVITPAGNWSSYPPHKHDQDRPGESVLEEIYYFQIAAGPARGWASSASTGPRTGPPTCSRRSGMVTLC